MSVVIKSVGVEIDFEFLTNSWDPFTIHSKEVTSVVTVQVPGVESKWFFQCSGSGISEKNTEDCCGFFLFLKSACSLNLNVGLKFTLKNKKKKELDIVWNSRNVDFCVTPDHKDKYIVHGKGNPNMISMAKLLDTDLGYNHDGKVNVNVGMLFKQSATLGAEVADMFAHNATSDFSILVDGMRICTHKMVLQLHSEVFKAMFDSKMKEASNNVIKIVDFDFATVKALIMCLYDHSLITAQLLAHSQKDLYRMAHKYMVKIIVDTAREYLVEGIQLENAVDILKHGDLYSDEVIKKRAMTFIVKNTLVLTKDHNLVSELSPTLWSELLTFMATEYTLVPTVHLDTSS